LLAPADPPLFPDVRRSSVLNAAGFASEYWDPRQIGLWSGILSGSTAVVWSWLNLAGRLPEPPREGVEPREVEVHGEPTV
ncbi:MAG: hypothetical protein K6T61_05400, partial [Bryobacteraceae bacterium]|nr:hypothetical protein [Bryobacteraceae bacterium]